MLEKSKRPQDNLPKERKKIDFDIDIDAKTQKKVKELGITMELNSDNQFCLKTSTLVVVGWDLKDVNLTGIKMRFNKEKGVVVLTKYYNNKKTHIYEFGQNLQFVCISHPEENFLDR